MPSVLGIWGGFAHSLTIKSKGFIMKQTKVPSIIGRALATFLVNTVVVRDAEVTRKAARKAASAMEGIASAAVNASKKAENYSAEQTVALVAAYAGGAGKTISELATQFGKTEKSIVAKLSREKVYVKKSRVSKVTGGEPEKKEEIVQDIAALMGVTEDKLAGFEKANKTGLLLVKEAFTLLTSIIDASGAGEIEQADGSTAGLSFAVADNFGDSEAKDAE